MVFVRELVSTLRVALAFMVLGLAAMPGTTAWAMDLTTFGNTIILSGPVTGSELVMVKNAFAANPKIDLVVLRNSHGGEAWTGYRVGEFLRDAGVTTAVSGYCVSSCSRMFLGGKNRLFTDDYPATSTYVGFHGHYGDDGNLDRKSVNKSGLFPWIIKYSDGKADPDLVMRWISIEKNIGAANFFHPDVSAALGNSVFFCDGMTAQKPTSCEPLATNALERGVVTDLRRISSPDLTKLPLDVPAGVEQYQRYLQAKLPKAFAVAPTRQHWGWVSGGTEDTSAAALQRCEERAKQTCVLYSVDNKVVYRKE